jgi:hypothetical protein
MPSYAAKRKETPLEIRDWRLEAEASEISAPN